MEKKVIYIADTHFISFLGLSTLFRNFWGTDIEIEQIHSQEILEYKSGKLAPDIIVIDYLNFEFYSSCTIKEIQKLVPSASIIVVTEDADFRTIKEVMKSGVSYLIAKSAAEDDFINAMKALQNKRKYISSEFYEILLQKERKSHDPENCKLSPSEIEIVKLISNGKTTKEIAEIKQLSFHTINTHRKNIFRKLNINNATELVRYAANSGLLNDIEYYI